MHFEMQGENADKLCALGSGENWGLGILYELENGRNVQGWHLGVVLPSWDCLINYLDLLPAGEKTSPRTEVFYEGEK